MSARVRTSARSSASAMFSSTTSPRVSSPMPGARRRSPRRRTVTSVPGGKTVSRCATIATVSRPATPARRARTFPLSSTVTRASPASRRSAANRCPRSASPNGGAGISVSSIRAASAVRSSMRASARAWRTSGRPATTRMAASYSESGDWASAGRGLQTVSAIPIATAGHFMACTLRCLRRAGQESVPKDGAVSHGEAQTPGGWFGAAAPQGAAEPPGADCRATATVRPAPRPGVLRGFRPSRCCLRGRRTRTWVHRSASGESGPSRAGSRPSGR